MSERPSTPGPTAALEELFARSRLERLDNGLTVCLLHNPQAPLVATSLWYRAGTRDEPPALGGLAHFLEHMMFKGSRRFAAGAIDHLTQSLGGSNNAFTSHDATSYYFTFSRDRWDRALDIEADRMAALTLAPDEVERERRVVLEEIAMYEDDPWDALELRVYRTVYGDHPYGRPVLGDRDTLPRIGRDDLAAFHARYYCPANAVLVLAGDVGERALARVEERFAALPGGESVSRPVAALTPFVARSAGGPVRIRQHRGDSARLLVALPAPAGGEEDYAPLWLALWVLAGGRASRLYRALVGEGRLCASVSADATEMVGPSLTLIAAEPLNGVEEAAVEAVVLEALAALREPPSQAELERARRLLLADWVFALERIHQQALLTGGALTLFDPLHPVTFLRRVEAATVEDVAGAARRYLDLDAGGVVAWSVPVE